MINTTSNEILTQKCRYLQKQGEHYFAMRILEPFFQSSWQHVLLYSQETSALVLEYLVYSAQQAR